MYVAEGPWIMEDLRSLRKMGTMLIYVFLVYIVRIEYLWWLRRRWGL